MYCVVVQSFDSFKVLRTVKCFNLSTVQQVLEKLDSNMDFAYLMNGELDSVTNIETGIIYSFFKLEHSDCIIHENNKATNS